MDYDYFIGFVYFTISLSGFLLNSIVVFVKLKFRKEHYSNVTFIFMISLAISDNCVLLSIGIMGALLIFCPWFQIEMVNRVFAYITGIGWYSGAVYFCVISVSRYVSIVRNSKLKIYFSPKILRFLVIFPFVFCMVYFSTSFWREPLEFK